MPKNVSTVYLEDLDRTIEIKKLPIGAVAEMFGSLREIMKYIKDIEKTSVDDLIMQIPTIVQNSGDDLAGVIAAACRGQLTHEEAAELGFDEVVDIVVAILETNKWRKIQSSIKKLMALSNQTPTTVKAPTTST